MSKRKPLGVSPTMGAALKKTVDEPAEEEARGYHAYLPREEIRIDPDNHRVLEIEPEQLKGDIAEACPPDVNLAEHLGELEPEDVICDGVTLTEKGRAEVLSLLELAASIATSSIIQSLRAYRRGDHYVLVAGERRLLASIIAGRDAVPVYVYQNPPSQQEIKIAQWAENKLREDLPPRDEIMALRSIVREMAAANRGSMPTVRAIAARLGVSRSQAWRVQAVGRMSDDVVQAVNAGHITSLVVAAQIASEKDDTKRAQMIRAVANSASVRAAQAALDHLENGTGDKSDKTDRSARRTNLGKVPPRAAQRLIRAVLADDEFAQLRDTVGKLPDYPSNQDIARAWKRLVTALQVDDEEN